MYNFDGFRVFLILRPGPGSDLPDYLVNQAVPAGSFHVYCSGHSIVPLFFTCWVDNGQEPIYIYNFLKAVCLCCGSP